jgi:hypothetical protein
MVMVVSLDSGTLGSSYDSVPVQVTLPVATDAPGGTELRSTPPPASPPAPPAAELATGVGGSVDPGGVVTGVGVAAPPDAVVQPSTSRVPPASARNVPDIN